MELYGPTLPKKKSIHAYGGEQEGSDPPAERLWYYDILHDTWNVSIAHGITSVSSTGWGES